MRHKLVGGIMICVWRKEEKKDWRSRKLLLLLSLFNLSTYRRSPRMKLAGIPRYTTYPWWKTVVMWLESSLIVPGWWQEGCWLSFQYILAPKPKLCIAWSYWGLQPIHVLCYWTPDRIISDSVIMAPTENMIELGCWLCVGGAVSANVMLVKRLSRVATNRNQYTGREE